MNTLYQLSYFDKYLIRSNSIKDLLNLHIFHKPTESDDFVSFQTYDDYALFYSPVVQIRSFFYKYAIKKINYCNLVTGKNKDFFVFNLPTKKEEKEQFLRMVNSVGIRFQNQIILKYTNENFSRVETSFLSSHLKELPKLWCDRLPILSEELKATSTIVFKPPKNPKFALFFSAEMKTVNEFVSNHNVLGMELSLYDFYFFCVLWSLLLLSTGLYKQEEITTIYAKTKDILNLLPANFTLESLLDKKSQKYSIEKYNNYLIFNYNLEYFSWFKEQRVNVPLALLTHAFNPKNLGRNGLPFLLLFLFPYHSRYHRIKYKPSTIVKLGKISTKRGTTYTLNVLNRNLSYLSQIGLIENHIPLLTKQDLREDKGILFILCDLADWQPPAQTTD